MLVFRNQKWNLTEINEKLFDLEKDLQKLTEENLSVIFGLQFIATEFALQEFRLDTLTYDEENNSFTIIEYKRWSSYSVVDQGFSYLWLLLNNKAHFVLEYNNKTGKNLSIKDINRESSKVIFVANAFNAYQRNAIDFKDLPIELRETKQFGTDTIIYNQIKAKNVTASVKTLTKNADSEVNKVMKEIKVSTVEDFLSKETQERKDLYNEFEERLLSLDARIVWPIPHSTSITFKIGKTNIFGLESRKQQGFFLRKHMTKEKFSSFPDPEKKLRFNPKKANPDYWAWLFYITSSKDIDYAMFLIKQLIKIYS